VKVPERLSSGPDPTQKRKALRLGGFFGESDDQDDLPLIGSLRREAHPIPHFGKREGGLTRGLVGRAQQGAAHQACRLGDDDKGG
jgi:hypothetical protein